MTLVRDSARESDGDFADIDIPLSLRDKIEANSEIDFFALGEEFEKSPLGLKAITFNNEDDANHRKRLRSDDLHILKDAQDYDRSKQEFRESSGAKPKILNYVYEIRRFLK